MAKPNFDNYEDDITFNLLNQFTIDRLIREGEVEVPKKKVAIPKDERWNTKLMGSKLLRGLQNGDSIKEIAKSLEDVVGTNNFSAIRNARTMFTSAENNGRLDSYKNLSSQGVVMKKEWEATPDDRVRPSHRDMDGEEQDIDKLFSNGCMFPGDGHGPAEEVWMCRCAMGSHIVGFKKADGSLSRVKYGRDKTLHDDQMYAKRLKDAGKKTAPTIVAQTWNDQIKAIAEDMRLNGVAEEKVLEAGRILAKEVNPVLQARIDEHQKLLDEIDRIGGKEIQAIREDRKYKDALAIRRNLMTISESEHWKYSTLDDIFAYAKKCDNRLRELEENPRYRELLHEKLASTRRMNGTLQENAKLMADKLSKVREVGTTSIDKKALKAHLGNSRSPVRKNIEEAYAHYPKSWVEKSMSYGNMRVGKTSRGYYQHSVLHDSNIMISGYSSESCTETAFHELGHRFERIVENIRLSEKTFYERRTAGEELKWLGSGYAKSEKTRADDFLSAYMGKDYGGNAYELVSMGFEYAYTDPIRLMKDEDMQAWIFGILSTL